jgi:NTE family protein
MAEGVPTVRTAIVLQGGGGLGAYELGVLKALYAERPGFTPAVVSGTSIGAVTTAVLAGAKGDPIAALDYLWRQKLTVPPPAFAGLTAWWPPELKRSLAVLGNPGMYRIRPEFLFAPWLCSSIYDTAPLRQTLGQLVDLDRLNDGHIRAIVGAIDVGTAESKFFDSGDGRISFDEVVASGSLPPGFPMTPIDGTSYWDGGLFTNTPLGPAINALEECDGGDPAVQRELIVVELFPMGAPIPRSLPDVVERMVQLQYASRIVLDRKFFDKIDHVVDLVRKVDAVLPPDSDVRQDPEFQKLLAHRKIDRFTVVTANFAPGLGNASDYSAASVEARIEAGYRDAVDQGIAGRSGPDGDPLRLGAAGGRSRSGPAARSATPAP